MARRTGTSHRTVINQRMATVHPISRRLMPVLASGSLAAVAGKSITTTGIRSIMVVVTGTVNNINNSTFNNRLSVSRLHRSSLVKSRPNHRAASFTIARHSVIAVTKSASPSGARK